MDPDYPPFSLPPPETARRRNARHNVPASSEIVARRAVRREIADNLKLQIAPLSNSLHAMSDDERKAVFYKIEHSGAAKLDIRSFTGTDLKPMTAPGENFTLVIPKSDDLEKLLKKVEDYGGGEPRDDGRVPNERLVTAIESVVRGAPSDRLSEELFEAYEELVRSDWVMCELEMISYEVGKNKQRADVHRIKDELEAAFDEGDQGEILEHEEAKGTIRAVVRCTGQMFKRLVEDSEWQQQIFRFEARPEFESFQAITDGFTVNKLGPITPPDGDAPVVCIVDSGVTAGNPFLTPVTREDMLLSFLKQASGDPADENGHGSGVASLAAYYALKTTEGAENSGKVWVAGARILDRYNRADEGLLSLVLEDVVKTFAPLGVRIFNLSVNITNRRWSAESKRTVERRSWVARTLDRLSREYDVVFVVSTGNIETWQVAEFHDEGKEYPAYLMEEETRILDPGQAALALTVGALARTTKAVGNVGTAQAIAELNQPAPFTRCGPGINREIKPELVELSGNYLIDPGGGRVRANPGTSIPVASAQLSPALAYDAGTSLAAPRAAHKLALVLRDLRAGGVNPVSAPLLKAFLVNSAQYYLGEELTAFKAALNAADSNHWLNILGYGVPDGDRATTCDRYSALFFYQGQIEAKGIIYFPIPVPKILCQTLRGKKRLTVTVTYAPEVQRWGLDEYLGTRLKWKLFRGDISPDDVSSAMSYDEEAEKNTAGSESNGADEENADGPKDLQFEIGITRRSRGTVQHDVYEWTTHQEHYSENFYTLAIESHERWQRINPPPVPLAVVVRLEDRMRSTEVYTEVRNLIRTRTRIRA
jgi:hypothetical protein